jgi:hypothetical protein
MKVIGFILTKNNKNLILKAINKIPSSISEFFISDDKSSDGIEILCKKKNINFFKNQSKKSGYGSNIKNALKIAFQKYKADYAVEIHGDGAQFDPIATNDAIKVINNYNADLIIGSRFLSLKNNLKLGYPLSRMIPNLIISTIEKKILNINISDFHSGFKVYSKKLYTKLNIKKFSDDYLFSFEVILYSKENKLKIKEVPVLCDYKSEHTSHKLFGNNSAFTYQLKTFKLIFLYFIRMFKKFF